MIKFSHQPVMLYEMLQALNPANGEIYLDATFGGGGYSKAILNKATCMVWAIDRDPDAVARAAKMSEPRFTILRGNFGNMENLLADHRVERLNGIVMDLGVSSPQIDDAARGFSFRYDGPLDMRMSLEGPTAAELVNKADEENLAGIIRIFGEERFARRIAKAIVAARSHKSIENTYALANIIKSAVPKTKDGLNPATRTFMALRIYINDELGELERALDAAERLLAPGGRLVVVAFHSLEDRRVKQFLDSRTGHGISRSRHLPPIDVEKKPTFCQAKRRALKPSKNEIQINPRARSARLRVAHRTDIAAGGFPPFQNSSLKVGASA